MLKASHLAPTCLSHSPCDFGCALSPTLHPGTVPDRASVPRGDRHRLRLEPRHHKPAFPGRCGAVLEAQGRLLATRFKPLKNTASHTSSGSPARPTHPARAPKVVHDGQRHALLPTRGPCRNPQPSCLGQNGVSRFAGSDLVERGSPRELRRHSCAIPPRGDAPPRSQLLACALRAAYPLSGLRGRASILDDARPFLKRF